MLKNIILCGGSGTRLWPLSRKLMPKQFLKLFDDKSLFQKTIQRNKNLVDSIEVITNEEQYFIALDQTEEIGVSPKFILEESGRNTAPAIAFAAFGSNEEDILFVTPSDHLIKNEEKYTQAIKKAQELAQDNYIVTFGITPTEPNTGYGYIQAKPQKGESVGMNVELFHEKPDVDTAKEYLNKNSTFNIHNSQLFLWNSGMFMFKAGVFLKELKHHSPKLYQACKEVYENNIKPIKKTQIRITNMQDIADISIDYALMEKSTKIKVVKSEFDWNDVGSFDALIEEIDSKEAIEVESDNNFYYTDNPKKVIATIGVQDFIIIDTKDALLISKKGETQKVKNIVNELKKEDHPTLYEHAIVYRPWGTYETLITDKGYKIKRIIVKPGKRLSLQKHFHRSEHWVVVNGIAEVTKGDEVFLLRPNESTYIPIGVVHRLANPGKIPLEIVEVQVGEYLSEDDIVRLEDDYGRD